MTYGIVMRCPSGTTDKYHYFWSKYKAHALIIISVTIITDSNRFKHLLRFIPCTPCEVMGYFFSAVLTQQYLFQVAIKKRTFSFNVNIYEVSFSYFALSSLRLPVKMVLYLHLYSQQC